MAPSKRRSVLERKMDRALRVTTCPCVDKPHSDGLCALNVWQGTMLDEEAAASGKRLLRPRLPVVKYKRWTCFQHSGRLYHLVILGWPQLLALFCALYLAIVGFFALLFAACNGIEYPTENAEARYYFNLSLQTLATIGYGYLYPKDSCSNWVAVAESFVAMLLSAFMTGVAFVKFARPQPNIIFSKVFTVTPRESGGLEMRFRVVNGTRREVISHGEILEVSFKLILMRVETTKTGEKKLCYYDLRLQTSSYIALRLEVELVHHIDEWSPFDGLSRAAIERSDFILILIMSGVDQNLHDTIHKQYEYDFASMQWGARFVSMLEWQPKHACLELDCDKVSTTVAAPIDASDVIDENDPVAVEMHHDIEALAAQSPRGAQQQFVDSASSNVESASDRDVDLDAINYGPSLSPDRPASLSTPIDEDAVSSLSPNDADASNGRRTAFYTVDDTNDDDDEQQETKSETSTKTNSDEEEIAKRSRHDGSQTHHHIRFDRGSRTTVMQLPRLPHRRHNHESSFSSLSEQLASVARRRVRFKHHPRSIFSKSLYYRALEMPWPHLFVTLVVFYFAVLAFIALLMLVSPGTSVLQTNDISPVTKYEQLFFFCAQTISTIGYGALSPNPENNLVNWFVFVLVFAGTVVSTVLTGLAWAKFSIPEASTVLFSDNLLLTAFHGKRAVVFRAANNRSFGVLIEGSFRVSVVIINRRLERRETHELKLIRNVWPIVQLGTTVTHIIDEDSPLFDVSTDDLLSGHHFFVVLFTGLDSVIGENMFARKTYHSCDVLVGHHFVDNIKLATDGLHIDLEAINDTQFTPDSELRESHLYVQSKAAATGAAGVAPDAVASRDEQVDDQRQRTSSERQNDDDNANDDSARFMEPTSPTASFAAMRDTAPCDSV